MSISLIKKGQGFFGIEAGVKEGGERLFKEFRRSLAKGAPSENIYVMCLEDGRLTVYHRDLGTCISSELITDQEIGREIRNLRPRDWLCLFNDLADGFKLLPKRLICNQPMRLADFVFHLMKDGKRIKGISVDIGCGASESARFFVASFSRYFNNNMAHVYAHNNKLYFRHFDFRFGDSPFFNLTDEEFVRLEKLINEHWICRSIENSSRFELMLKSYSL